MAKGSENNNPTEKKTVEIMYSVSDLMAAARKRFKVSPDIVYAALKIAKKDKATIYEAEQIIKKFTERKIK